MSLLEAYIFPDSKSFFLRNNIYQALFDNKYPVHCLQNIPPFCIVIS